MKNCTCVSLIWQFSSLCWCSQDYDVCFFGLKHCGRRCCARFFIWIYNVCKTRINFLMRVFVFLFWGILKMDFSMGVFVFWCQHYWKLIFQWKSWFLLVSSLLKIDFSMKVFVFFGFRPIKNCFFNENLCFFSLRHCGRRCCALFPFEFTMFLGPALFFQWGCLFFALRPIENRIIKENLCFFGLRPIENRFFNDSLCFFGLRPIENCFFNESVCFWVFFNESLCCFWVSGLLKIDFSRRVLVFLVSTIVEDGAVPFLYMNLKCFLKPKWIFQWESLFFWFQAYWKLIFRLVFVFLVYGLLKFDLSMRVFVFFGLRPIENWFFNESVCFLGLRHCGRRCCARFFIWIYTVFRARINFSMKVFVFLVSGLLKMDFLMKAFVFFGFRFIEN